MITLDENNFILCSESVFIDHAEEKEEGLLSGCSQEGVLGVRTLELSFLNIYILLNKYLFTEDHVTPFHLSSTLSPFQDFQTFVD